MAEQELLRECPFCPDGGAPYFTKTVNGTNMAYVGCSKCGVELKAQVQFLTNREDWTLSKDIIGIWKARALHRAGTRRARVALSICREA